MQETQSLHQKAEVVDLNPFPGETTFFNRLVVDPTRRDSKTLRKEQRVSLLPLLVLTALLVTIGWRTLDGKNPLIEACSDFKTLFGISNSTGPKCDLGNETRSFGLARDVLSLVALLILGLTPHLIYRQWRAYSNLLTSMVQEGSIRFTGGATSSTLKIEVERANNWIRRAGLRSGLTLLLVAFTIHRIVHSQMQEGVFERFAPAGIEDASVWAKQQYAGWWASIDTNAFHAAVYFMMGTWGLYIITQQNLVGGRIMWAMYRSRTSFTFGADVFNRDGYYGWGVVRNALVATYVELAVHGVALLAVVLVMPRGSFVGPLSIAAWQWLASLPMHIAFHFYFVRGKIGRFKEQEINNLAQDAATLPATLSPGERTVQEVAISEKIAMIRAIPTLPFKKPRDIMIFGAALVADFAVLIPMLYVGVRII